MAFRQGAAWVGELKRAAELDTTLTEYHYDPTTDELVVRESQDIEPVLDFCAERRVHDPYGRIKAAREGREWRYIGEIPNILVAQWLNDRCTCDKGAKRQVRQGLAPEHGFNAYTCDGRVLRKKLRDSAYAKIRTSEKPRDRVGAGWGK